MSTAGKVLSVLVALSILGAIFLSASVAELNRSWGQKVIQVENELKQAQDAIPPVIVEVRQLRDQINLIQLEKDDQLTRLRSELSKLQKADSYTKETLDRYNIQFAGTDQQIQMAKQFLEIAKRERSETQQNYARTLAELNQLAEENSQMLAELERLRSQFVATLHESQSAVHEILGEDGDPHTRSAARRTRPASMAVPVPVR
jgi:chromosome segregation ATPase